jgi:hypothetical protein
LLFTFETFNEAFSSNIFFGIGLEIDSEVSALWVACFVSAVLLDGLVAETLRVFVKWIVLVKH